MVNSVRGGGSSGDGGSSGVGGGVVGENINDDYVVEGVVDYKGRKVTNRYKFGRWRSAGFIYGIQIAESLAIFGIGSNLITYLTGPLGQSTTSAAKNVNALYGVASMLPLLGAFVADSYIGRFRTIFISSLLFILGLGILTAQPILLSHGGSNHEKTTSSSNRLQSVIFFISLYIIVIAQGGYQPCSLTFAADQFDGLDPEESKYKSTFFNWWFFGSCACNTVSILILNYIQDNLSWGLSFGISCICMTLGFIVFLLGTKTYRYSIKKDGTNPFLRICQVFVAASKNRKTDISHVRDDVEESGNRRPSAINDSSSQQFKFLDKALIANGSRNGPTITSSQVEEAKAVLRLIPIWASCLPYGVVFAQASTFFTKQGNTMERSITQNFKIPASALQSFIGVSIVVFLPIYDRIFVPIARKFTSNNSGITMLQRVGCGMVLSVISMVVAAIVEKKRLQTALDFGLVDVPKATVPMSIWLLVPQYVLFGLADVFALVGLQEFFYDQVPDELRSVGVSLYLSILGLGSLFSGLMVSIIESITSKDGTQYSWFQNNLNRAHLDLFYWLLAGLSVIELVGYLYFSKSYKYKKKDSL